jgi:hypothetical protein
LRDEVIAILGEFKTGEDTGGGVATGKLPGVLPAAAFFSI